MKSFNILATHSNSKVLSQRNLFVTKNDKAGQQVSQSKQTSMMMTTPMWATAFKEQKQNT